MKNKGNKIAALILTLAITIIAHPFSIVKAQNATATVTTANDYFYDGTSYRNKSIITCNIDDVASGYWYFTPSNNNISSSQIVAYNCRVSLTGSDVYVYFEHTDFMYIEIYSYTNANAATVQSWNMIASLDNDPLTEIIANQEIIITDILTLIQDIEDYNSLYSSYNTPIISSIKYIENQGQTGTNVSSYEYTNSSYNSNSYSYRNNSGRSIKRIEVQYKNNIQYSGNYVVFQYLFYCTSIQSSDVFKNLQIRNREQSSTMLITITDAITFLTKFDFQNDNKSLLYLTLYVPITSFSEYNNGEYRIDILNFTLNDVIRSKFSFLGIVENLPETEPYNYNSSSTDQINNLTSELNQQIQDSNQAQQSIDNMLDDFNLNFDLNDYRFIFDNNAFYYFKQKLTDIYDINLIKPFYIIPLVLFIVWRLLSG